MKVLGIESSSLVASVALVTDDILTAEYTVNFKKTHSQTLLPMLDEIVKCWDWTWRLLMPLQQQGPGSFTGLVLAQLLQKDWTGIKEASDPCTYSRCYCLQYVGHPVLSALLWTQKMPVYTGLYHNGNGIETVNGSSALWIWEN